MKNLRRMSLPFAVLSMLLVSGCGASANTAQPVQNQPETFNPSTNAPGNETIGTETRGTNAPEISPANPGGTGAIQTASTPTTLNISGKQIKPVHPIEQRDGIWFISSDEISQIFNTYPDSTKSSHMVVNLDSIVSLDFNLQKPVVTIGDTQQTLPVGAYREGNGVYLPIQTIADQCGVKVQYDSALNQLTLQSATLHFRLPLTSDGTLQTVITPGSEQTAPLQILDGNGRMLLTTAGQQVPIVGLQFFNVGAGSPLVVVISQGGTGGQLYTAYLYDATARQFRGVSWGTDSSSSSVLGFIGYNADTHMISLSQKTYDTLRHLVTTGYKWTPQQDSPVGRLEAVSTSYGPAISSSNLPKSLDPGMLLSAALTSVAEHLPQETSLFFANPVDGAAFYAKWEPVFPFGDTVSEELSHWSERDALAGNPQTVVVTTMNSQGEKIQYQCKVIFATQAGSYRIQSMDLTPISK